MEGLLDNLLDNLHHIYHGDKKVDEYVSATSEHGDQVQGDFRTTGRSFLSTPDAPCFTLVYTGPWQGPVETSKDWQGPVVTSKDRQGPVETSRYWQSHQRPAETNRDNQRPTETNRDQQRPAETNRDQQRSANKAPVLRVLVLVCWTRKDNRD